MKKYWKLDLSLANRLLLGLLILIPGIMKLFVMGPEKVIGMLNNLGFPLAEIFAWILIFGEIISGILIIANWKLKYVVFIPAIILLVAAFTVHIKDFSRIIIHLALITNYFLIAYPKK